MNAQELPKNFFLRKSDSEMNESRPPEPNLTYELIDEKVSLVFDILKSIMDNSTYSFYGFSVIPNGLDILIDFKTDMVASECFSTFLPHISELVINPIDEYFFVRLRISKAIKIAGSDLF